MREFEHFGEALEIGRNQRRGLLNEQSLRGIDNIVRRQAVVEPARMWANDFCDGRGEGNDVVLDLGLDLERCVRR